ncbi:MAG TPA: hypothetical protein VHO03_00690 [Ignavibacteriales bacterium]|nr:hypothetical protein [Ignavibacteriales bacterium]
MFKNLLTASVFLLVFAPFIQAQNLRIMSLGGIKYGLDDRDNSLNPYDFGGNPAWLIKDEKETWQRITPSFDRLWGEYKRPYDCESEDKDGISFTGVKPLGESGTFLGRAFYSYEARNDVYRSLEYNPYGGEAFFITDTTKGNFRYDGPGVGFIYSYELLPGLFTGLEAGYRLMDGLKNVYSAAKTLYRDVDGKLGLAYKLTNGLVLGLDFELLDTQESLEMKDELSQGEVEIFNYRGENYSTYLRRAVVKEKIRKQGRKFASQILYSPAENLEGAVKAEFALSETKFLVPSNGLKEFEESFADFQNYYLEFRAKYTPLCNLIIGGEFSYLQKDSWTKNSGSGLLLWEWNLRRTTLGAGTTYKIEPLDLLLGIDYEAELIKADSSKYIDVKFNSVSGLNNNVRLGAEYRLLNDFYLRAGYSLGRKQVDLISGGKSVALKSAVIGAAINIFKETKIDFMAGYGNEAPSGYVDYSRNHFSASAAVRLNSF